MTNTMSSVEFPLPVSLAPGKLKTTLKQKLNFTEQVGEQVEICCLDTFDWRLFKKGLALETYDDGDVSRFRLRTLNSAEYVCSESVTKQVNFAWDFPEGRLREQLSKITKIRALIPQVWLFVKRNRLVLLDKEKKTVSRVVLEEIQVYDEESDLYKLLQKRLLLLPVRGYPGPHEKTKTFIKNEWDLQIAKGDILGAAVSALDLRPGEYSTKSKIKLTENLTADRAVKNLLRELLDTLESLEEGICEEVDTEFLHDYRVAIRKTRSAFKQVDSVFPQKESEKYQEKFYWLGSITSPARDMDVYLLKFDSYRSMIPAKFHGSLEPLEKLLEKKRRQAYNTLKRTLNSKRYQALKTEYRNFLENISEDPEAGNAEKPVKIVADKRIWKVYKKVMKQGTAINDESPPGDLHELRISCKKLRYLIEFFQSLYGSKKIKRLIKDMKKLQDNLGEYNDLHVQVEKLKDFSTELKNQKTHSEDTVTAMNMLVNHLEELQDSQRTDFARRFEKFSDKTVQKKFKDLFKSSRSIIDEVR